VVTIVPGSAVWESSGLDVELQDSPALLLPTEDETLLLNVLARSWAGFSWYGLGTWFGRGDTNSVRGFAERFPELAREQVAQATGTTPRGLAVRSEWVALDPTAEGLVDFYGGVRSSAGKGSALALLPPEASVRAWYAASTALVNRALLAVEAPGDVDIAPAQRAAVASYLGLATRAGTAAVVPLRVHPSAGCLVVGDRALLARLAALLPVTAPVSGDVDWQTIVDQASGPAL
jgi:hypothetical protein